MREAKGACYEVIIMSGSRVWSIALFEAISRQSSDGQKNTPIYLPHIGFWLTPNTFINDTR